jgi:hypothetical protein
MTDLAASCAAIAEWLPVARALITEPDTDGTTRGGKPGSHPPGNSAAINAAMDAHAGLRALEASLRLEVTGHSGPRRGGSDANTTAAIAAIEALGTAVTTAAMAQAARVLDRWSRQIQELPAVDEAEPWRRVQGVACPYCKLTMLAVRPREGTVTCLRHGACSDSDGRHPVGRMDVSRLTGDPLIRWADGLVAP